MWLTRDGLLGLICLGISGVLFAMSLSLPHLPIVPVGPGFYPRIVLSFLALASFALVVQDWLAHRRSRLEAPKAETPGSTEAKNYSGVIIAFALVTAYVVALPYLGFRISTIGFVGLFQIALDRPRSIQAWLRVLLVAVGTAVLCYVVFESYLSVLLPRGLWTGW